MAEENKNLDESASESLKTTYRPKHFKAPEPSTDSACVSDRQLESEVDSILSEFGVPSASLQTPVAQQEPVTLPEPEAVLEPAAPLISSISDLQTSSEQQSSGRDLLGELPPVENVALESQSTACEQTYSPNESETFDGEENDNPYLDQKILRELSIRRKTRTLITSFVNSAFVIAVALLIAILIRTFLFEPFKVPTGSMLQTIQLQNVLIGDKLSLRFSSVKQHEIVTFIDPDNPDKTLIKRVIGLPGQTIDLKDGVLYVDGKAQVEPYVNGQKTYPINNMWSKTLPNGPIKYPYKIPDNSIWVMGDNRGNSLDSRYFGAVSLDNVTSIARIIIWPLKDVKML